MKNYLELLQDVLDNGVEKSDRTGVGTLSVFGRQLRFDLSKGFPLITTRKMNFDTIKSEILWFLEGSSDERRLCEIRHGSMDDSLKTIWTGNANMPSWEYKREFKGHVGKSYGKQMRSWGSEWIPGTDDQFGYYKEGIDQISNIVNSIKTDPNSRRHLVNMWNVAELDEVCLVPCHFAFVFNVTNGKLSCSVHQRSCDLPIGNNVATYALMTHLIARATDLEVGDLIMSYDDTHIYLNHIEGIKEQLKREPLELCQLWLNPDKKDIDSWNMDDIKIIDYKHHPFIKFEMAV